MVDYLSCIEENGGVKDITELHKIPRTICFSIIKSLFIELSISCSYQWSLLLSFLLTRLFIRKLYWCTQNAKIFWCFKILPFFNIMILLIVKLSLLSFFASFLCKFFSLITLSVVSLFLVFKGKSYKFSFTFSYCL